jgi:hypothetical protein
MMPLAKTHNSHSFKPTTNHNLSRLKENMIVVMNHLTNVGNWTKEAQALVDKLFGSRPPPQVPLVECKPHEHIDGGADGDEVALGFTPGC